jgi:peptide/nickel transport system ATP-binding protein/oligopeptide transport system ATP-binding protein
MAELQTKRNIGIIFISHDLAVVADIADQIIVMQTGKVVEHSDRQGIFENAQHPYTRKLLAAIPSGTKEPNTAAPEPLIRLRNLNTWFSQGRNKEPVKAVNNVTLEVNKGEILGLVGESGSGKSTLGRSILKLVPITSGTVEFDGEDITVMKGAELKTMRRRMQMIFQDPYASLNPRMSVYDTLAEPLILHGIESKKTAAQGVLKLMDDVGLARNFVRKYPHEFSGGQRQRIAIGRALATRPEFIVADEPVSALDVTIQAQILDLMLDLGREYGLTMLFVSHDLAVVKHIADRIVVLYKGEIVEQGTGHDLFENPQQDYTRQLLQSIPGRALLA